MDIKVVIDNFVTMFKWVRIVLFVFIAGCSQKIVSYTNSKATFQKFETYRLISPKIDNKVGTETSLGYKMIRENIIAEMSRRGYTESMVAPSLILRYELASSTRVETSVNQSFFYPTYQINSRTIHEGILLLELHDQNKKLVWQGSYDLNQEKKEKRIRKVIENAVGRIFTSYPYRASQKDPDPTLTEFKKKAR